MFQIISLSEDVNSTSWLHTSLVSVCLVIIKKKKTESDINLIVSGLVSSPP